MCGSARMRAHFFVTCGRGMEPFVIKELTSMTTGSNEDEHRHQLFSNVESVHDGKVFFELLLNGDEAHDHLLLQEKLLSLKSVERIFVCGTYYRKDHLPSKRLYRTDDDRPYLNVMDSHSTNQCLTTTNLFDFVFSTCNDIADAADGQWSKGFSVWSRLSPTYMPMCRVINEDDNGEGVAAKRIKYSLKDAPISFRVSCKSSGRVSRQCPPQKLSRWIVRSVERNLPNWTTDLRNPDLEVYVHLNDEFLVIGFPLCRGQPLSRRPYLTTIALRTTVCWAMCCATLIKPGDKILDPMCGAGTLLVEAAKCWPVSFAVGVDMDWNQLIASKRNIEHSGVIGVALLQGKVQNLPMQDHYFDAILCDFPFGLKYSTVKEAELLLPKAVLEIDRVCKEGGRITFLLSLELNEILTQILDKKAGKCFNTSNSRVSNMIPRSVLIAKCNRFSTSASNPSTVTTPVVENISSCLSTKTNAINTEKVVDDICAVNWKRLSTNRLNLGDLDACIVVHIKR